MGHKTKISANGQIFASTKDAAKHIGVTGSMISWAIKHNKTVKGYTISQISDSNYLDEVFLNSPYGFECSNYGRFRIGNKIFRGSTSKIDGYKRCRIGGKTYLMHRVVMKTFDPANEIIWMYADKYFESPQVDHIDQVNKDDNHVDNLRWATRTENMSYYKNK
jgi:hypothetical protein